MIVILRNQASCTRDRHLVMIYWSGDRYMENETTHSTCTATQNDKNKKNHND